MPFRGMSVTFEMLWQDIRYAGRLLRRSPGYAFTVIGVLALGIGANAASFGIFKAAFVTPLPAVDNATQLAVLVGRASGGRTVTVSYPDYQYLRDHSSAFSGLSASSPVPLTLGVAAGGERVWGELVSGNYFQVLGVDASLGRTLLPSDEDSSGREPVAVITDGLWRRAFGADPGVIGRTILINAQPLTVVGVAEPGFHGSMLSLVLDVFIPLTMQPQLQPPSRLAASGTRWLIPLGRLTPGTSVVAAAAHTELLAAQLAADDPIGDVSQRATVVPLWRSPFGAQTYLLPIVAVLAVTGILVLVIVCTNLANLVLARGLTRRAELAMRVAMGASRTQIVRLLLLENILLAIPAAGIGLVIATRLFTLFGSGGGPAATVAPSQLDTSIDTLVIGFALVVSCASAVAFGFIPAFRGSLVSLTAVMKEEGVAHGPAKARLRGALVIAQVAASLLLLVAAGLTLRTLEAARKADLGFDSSNVVSVRIDLVTSGYDDTRGRSFYKQLLDNLSSRPGIESASVADFVPLRMVEGRSRQVTVEGYEPLADEDLRFAVNVVGPDYFRTLRIGLLAGRAFSRDDSPTSPPVVIVNETIARRFWQTPTNAVGKRLRVGGDAGEWRAIVGVARDIKYLSLNEAPTPYFYMPFEQDYRPEMTVHVRGSAGTPDLMERVRGEVRTLDSGVPVLDAQTLADQARAGLVLYEAAASALMAFGLIAIGLAALGVYGLVSYTARQSTHEIGVRMALGAGRADVVLRFVRRGMKLALIGAAIGIGLSVMVTRLMRAVLYGVSAMDPVAFIGASVVVLGIALLASFVPSWRAACTDPIRALRHP